MLANIHVYILTAFLLSNLPQILDVAFLLPVSIVYDLDVPAHYTLLLIAYA